MKVKLSTVIVSAIIVILVLLIASFALIKGGYININLGGGQDNVFCYPNGTCVDSVSGAVVSDLGTEDGEDSTLVEEGIKFPEEPSFEDKKEVLPLGPTGGEVVEPVVGEGTPETEMQEETAEEEIDAAHTLTFLEGELVKLNLQATDPDGDSLYYTFSEPLDEDGTWQTKEGDEGKYLVTVEVSDGALITPIEVLLVIESTNKAPVIQPIEDIVVNEGDTIELNPVAADADGDDVEITYTGFMTSNTYETTYDDAGEYSVTITASDGKKESSQTVKITINNVNRAPVLEELEDKTLVEGQSVKIIPVASDPDGDDLVVAFDAPFDRDGTWQTEEGDAGEYTIEVIVSDRELEDSQEFTLIVESLNKAPVIQPIDDMVINEGDTIELAPVAVDEDGDAVEITYSGYMTSATKYVDYDTVATEEGSLEFEVVITASDGKAQSTETVKITVNNVNRPPVIIFG